MALFGGIFSGGSGQKAATDQINALNQAKGDISSDYGSGRDALNTDYAKALQDWQGITNTSTAGENAYADAMGLNGPEGSARAQAGFRNNPAYQFQLQQGLAASKAKAAASGGTMSGGQMIDLNNYAQGVANQGWGNYIQNLSPFLGQATTAAGATAGINTGLGNQLNANYMGEGTNLAGLDTAIGKAQAGGDMASYNAGANELGAIMGGAGDIASILGGKSGSGGTLGGQLFGKFLG
jgi:hypothetical protein